MRRAVGAQLVVELVRLVRAAVAVHLLRLPLQQMTRLRRQLVLLRRHFLPMIGVVAGGTRGGTTRGHFQDIGRRRRRRRAAEFGGVACGIV